jgi:hypothetical protein
LGIGFTPKRVTLLAVGWTLAALKNRL